MALILPPKLLRILNPRRRNRLPMLLKLFAALLLVIILLGYIIYKPPAELISALASQYPDVLWRVDGLPKDHKIIALTIDDAPSDQTPEILAVLAKYHARATFFVIGSQVKTDADRQRLVDIVSEGHELGNHAMRDEPSVSLETTTLVEQIHSVHDILSTAYRNAAAITASGAGMGTVAGLAQIHPPLFFRPGSGFFNSKMRSALAKLKYKLVLGDVYPHDPQIHNPNVNARHVISMARTGSVIICHDRRTWTAPMLDMVLQDLINKRGFEVTTVSRLLEAGDKALKAGHQVAMGNAEHDATKEKAKSTSGREDDDDDEDDHVDGHGHAKGREEVAKVVKDKVKEKKEKKKQSLAQRLLGT